MLQRNGEYLKLLLNQPINWVHGVLWVALGMFAKLFTILHHFYVSPVCQTLQEGYTYLSALASSNKAPNKKEIYSIRVFFALFFAWGTNGIWAEQIKGDSKCCFAFYFSLLFLSPGFPNEFILKIVDFRQSWRRTNFSRRRSSKYWKYNLS